MPPLMFAASVTVTKAREAKTWAGSAFLVHPRSPAGTMRTAVSSRFQMRPCEMMTRSCRSLRSLAMSASLGLWRVQARIRCRARAAHGRRHECCSQDAEGRMVAGPRWSAAVVRCAAVMPPAECVGCHGPEELRHQMLRQANVASERLAVDTRLVSVEVLEPQLRLVGYAHVCSLRGICLRLSRRVAFAHQRHWRHVVRRWQQWQFQVATNAVHRE